MRRAGPAAGVLGVLAVVAVGALAGFVFGGHVAPLEHNRMFPWIMARATGLGAFVVLGALNALGLLFRRPVTGRPRIHPESLLRLHAALGPAVIVLLAGHIAALLADHYSGVVWKSLVVPGAAHYRPMAVTFGTLSAELLVLVTASAILAGRRVVRSRWAILHKLALPTFVLACVHGVLAGSDTATLRGLYVGVGAVVVAAAIPTLVRRPAVALPRVES